MNPLFTYAPPTGPLDVIHHDDHILAINKPSGLLSVPGKAFEHRDCLETRVVMTYPKALLVHRLDMDTSGVMIFALTKDVQRHLSSQFQKRQMEKTYIARVQGLVTEDTGTVDLPLIVDWPNRPLQMVDFDRGKASVTNWSVLEREDEVTRMELRPKTGRSHQLRVHMRELGHPILGDRFYADGPTIAAADRLQLHAQTLRLHHPDGGEWLTLQTSCPF
ncbi:MAG: RluA family pseudouridine synthase [Amylibacter sp.]|nr:RluA family pseudouridine synthase [Amylibacter sp.]